MIRILGILLASVFAVLGLFHLYWAAGGRFGSGAAVPTTGGERLFNPSALGTVLVAVALFAAMLVVLGQIGLLGSSLPKWIFRWATFVIAALFLLRAIGDFKYVGFFKTVSHTDFARLDSLLFTPLCLLIAIAAFLISYNELDVMMNS
ncbi:MAG TPA: DUF3995 domain-containing protein [Pyrinomonadaceae bacterium]|jgi:hypothetical protein